MTRTSIHLGLVSITLALLGSMTTSADARIYPHPMKPGGELSNIGWFKPPSLHTNQGGRSHGGNTAIVIFSRPDQGFDNLASGSLVDNLLSMAFDAIPLEPLPGEAIMPGRGKSMPISSSLFTENGTMNNGNMLPGPGPLVLLLTAGLGMKRRRRRS